MFYGDVCRVATHEKGYNEYIVNKKNVNNDINVMLCIPILMKTFSPLKTKSHIFSIDYRIGIGIIKYILRNPKNLTYCPSTCKHVYFHWYSFRSDTLIKSANSNIRFKVLDSRHVSRHKVMYAITTTSFLDRKNLAQTYL